MRFIIGSISLKKIIKNAEKDIGVCPLVCFCWEFRLFPDIINSSAVQVFVHKSTPASLIISLGKILGRGITENCDLTNENDWKRKRKHSKLRKPRCLTHFTWAKKKHLMFWRAAGAVTNVLGRWLATVSKGPTGSGARCWVLDPPCVCTAREVLTCFVLCLSVA